MCWSLFLLQIENLLRSLPIADPEIEVKWSLVTLLILSLLCQPAPFCSLYLLGLNFNLRSFNTLICLSVLCCSSHFSLFLGRGGDQNSWLPVRINVNSWDLPPIKKNPNLHFLVLSFFSLLFNFWHKFLLCGVKIIFQYVWWPASFLWKMIETTQSGIES